MNQKQNALLFLAKNYHPFTAFTPNMLRYASNALRLFEVNAGEIFTIQNLGEEDSLFVIEGIATIKQESQTSVLVSSSHIDVQPIVFNDVITISSDCAATLCHVNYAMMNEYLASKENSAPCDIEDSEALTERLMFLKSTSVFRLLPVNIIEETAKRCHELMVKEGDLIIQQDIRADAFYILIEGTATVLQKDKDDRLQTIASLKSGDSFGKKSLVMGGGYQSTVKMSSDGIVLKISKADFEELVCTPSLRSVSPKVAQAMQENGAKIIDVRYPEEYEKESIENSTLIPLPELRQHLSSFDHTTDYLILCAVGLRAAAATLMLRQQDINAHYIEGGIKAWSSKTDKSLSLELILFDFCPFAQRAVITLQHTGIPHTLTYLNPDNLPDWFSKLSPFGKVPILRVDGKATIFESAVINEMIAALSTKNMLPKDSIQRSLCRSWIEFGSTLLSQLTALIMAENKEDFLRIQNEFNANLHYLEAYLQADTSIASGEFSLLDSTYAPLFMRMAYLNQRMDLYKKEDIKKIQTWMDDLLLHESVVNSVQGDFSDIYYKFIQRRGTTGYLVNTLLTSTLKKVA